MLIFQNSSRSHPIRVVPDTVPGVCYLSSPNGWIDSWSCRYCMTEPRAISKLVGGKVSTLHIENVPSHCEVLDVQLALENINTQHRKLPPTSTQLTKSADSFRDPKHQGFLGWNLGQAPFGFHRSMTFQWSNQAKWKRWGWKFGKLFYLNRSADVIRDLNNQVDWNGVHFSRQCMIRTGLSLNFNGNWEEELLSEKSQKL